MIRVTVWGENVHERTNDVVREVYPEGMHTTIAEGLRVDPGIEVRTATLDQDDDHGLSEEILDETDVLVWWGHAAHGKVRDEVVARTKKRVLEGMGLILLHSAHYSKIFKSLMGTTCSLCWREAGEKERLWVCNPGHPITQGLGKYFELPQTEMYGEPFGVPAPDEQVFISWFEGGEVFRSGITYFRGNGRIFYFRPGHETYPIFYDDNVRLVLRNAVRWAQPAGGRWIDNCPNVPIDEAPEPITRQGKGLHQDGDEGFR
ncbi:MAG: ThuA domain-containing protein [Candidatus Latescibacteria bacterium]|jgi:trehalose utilization protein|nr:trehalose utilization protein ThuA [Gemmatimonadaceae bacterium]MDP6018728.1 ThuA domain-containing protein [Candidatus Latescibacterota bacterium]MDP7447695.1 ThuA domain-containing protein [Candidatus Latescibacterota bacterium]HJP32652.1 ThuA domain-containing protein [Candidatus Latescibacterota bacterium]